MRDGVCGVKPQFPLDLGDSGGKRKGTVQLRFVRKRKPTQVVILTDVSKVLDFSLLPTPGEGCGGEERTERPTHHGGRWEPKTQEFPLLTARLPLLGRTLVSNNETHTHPRVTRQLPTQGRSFVPYRLRGLGRMGKSGP